MKIKSKSDFISRLNIQYKWIFGQFNIINKIVPVDFNDKVLEIGCGVGALLKILKDYNIKKLYATELDINARTFINEYLSIDVLNLAIEDEDFFKGNTFDKIYALEVIEHLNNPNLALEILYKLLNKDGTLIISTPPPNFLNLKDPSHLFVLDPICWKRNLQSVGFIEIKIIPMTGIPFLYKLSKFFSIHLPVNLSIRLFNTTNFFICKKS